MSEWPLMPTVPELKPAEFLVLREFVHSTFGLDLRDGKERLVSARLGKHIRAGGFGSFDQYLKHVRADRTGESLTQLIDSLTTNHTNFLREEEHFRFLISTLLPELRERRSVTIWSAASSTGEEPYSILFTLLDALQTGPSLDVRIVATDISTRVLRTARAGIYPHEKLRSVPPSWLQRYFHSVDRGSKEWQVRPEFRSRVEFRRLNLMDPLPAATRYPVIFCRNVMIYFDKQTQSGLVQRLSHALEDGGCLLVGHSESLTGIDHQLKYVRPAVYRKSK
jgi:chemotaxis protein methyltransferase CheR